MTTAQKKLLTQLATPGCDVNQAAQLAMASDKRTAKTFVALLKQDMLQIAPGGGLELSDRGRATAADLITEPNGPK